MKLVIVEFPAKNVTQKFRNGKDRLFVLTRLTNKEKWMSIKNYKIKILLKDV